MAYNLKYCNTHYSNQVWWYHDRITDVMALVRKQFEIEKMSHVTLEGDSLTDAQR